MATTDTTFTKVEQWRIATFEELGFTTRQAEQLLAATVPAKINGRWYDLKVDHHYLKKLLNSGATKRQILSIVI